MGPAPTSRRPSLRLGPGPGPDTAVLPLRYLPYCGGGVLPEWLAVPPARARVVVTLGTTVTRHVGVAPFRPLVEAATEVDAEFVLLLGSIDPGTLGTLPDNVRACGWLPLDAVVRDASVLVHHGGTGSMLVAISQGVPQLVLPQAHDQLFHAEALRKRGGGRTAEAGEVTAELIIDMINDESLRKTAAELRRELTELPTPARVVDQLTELAQKATGKSAA
jgi:UDP:flavonoid glycosyltransferase YjiC (YdhE family)